MKRSFSGYNFDSEPHVKNRSIRLDLPNPCLIYYHKSFVLLINIPQYWIQSRLCSHLILLSQLKLPMEIMTHSSKPILLARQTIFYVNNDFNLFGPTTLIFYYKNNYRSDANARTKVIIFCKSCPLNWN